MVQSTLHDVDCNCYYQYSIKQCQYLGILTTTDGILTAISPREIMTGDTLNYKRYLAITFGQNFQIHEEENPSKNTRNNTRDAICMSPRENKQGGFKYMTI